MNIRAVMEEVVGSKIISAVEVAEEITEPVVEEITGLAVVGPMVEVAEIMAIAVMAITMAQETITEAVMEAAERMEEMASLKKDINTILFYPKASEISGAFLFCTWGMLLSGSKA